jgi:hypothetical protein
LRKVQFTIDLSFKTQFSMHSIDTKPIDGEGVGRSNGPERDHTETTDNGRHKVRIVFSKSSLSSYSIAPL